MRIMAVGMVVMMVNGCSGRIEDGLRGGGVGVQVDDNSYDISESS